MGNLYCKGSINETNSTEKLGARENKTHIESTTASLISDKDLRSLVIPEKGVFERGQERDIGENFIRDVCAGTTSKDIVYPQSNRESPSRSVNENQSLVGNGMEIKSNLNRDIGENFIRNVCARTTSKDIVYPQSNSQSPSRSVNENQSLVGNGMEIKSNLNRDIGENFIRNVCAGTTSKDIVYPQSNRQSPSRSVNENQSLVGNGMEIKSNLNRDIGENFIRNVCAGTTSKDIVYPQSNSQSPSRSVNENQSLVGNGMEIKSNLNRDIGENFIRNVCIGPSSQDDIGHEDNFVANLQRDIEAQATQLKNQRVCLKRTQITKVIKRLKQARRSRKVPSLDRAVTSAIKYAHRNTRREKENLRELELQLNASEHLHDRFAG